MKQIVRMLCAMAIALPVVLAGCTSDAKEPPTQSRYLAMARGEVNVAGGLVRIAARHAGRLSTLVARLGQRVKAGDLLATLESNVQQTALSLASAEVRIAQARLQATRVARESAERTLSRLQAALAADAAPVQTVDDAQAALAGQVALERVAAAEAEAALVRRNAAEQVLSDSQIRAPVSGELVQINASMFQLVAEDDKTPLFVLLPDRPHIVRAELDEEFAAVLHDDTVAEIVLNDSAQTVIRATTVSVSNALHRRETAAPGAERDDSRVIDCEIGVNAPALRVGQQVLVRFLRGNT